MPIDASKVDLPLAPALVRCGFALFNRVEAVIDHRLPRLRSVREVADPTPWKVGFLVLSGLLLAVGLGLVRRRRSAADFPEDGDR